MSDSAFDRIQALFDQAVALPADQRRHFLDNACAEDSTIRFEVEALLIADDRSDSDDAAGLLATRLLRRSGPAGSNSGLVSGALPERIGPYRIVRRVAAGGMGAVYEAEQDNPRRRVALKIVHPGVTSPGLLQRIRDEAQILGRLHHPGIPQVYAAGVFEDDRPYFAMEFIQGQHFDAYVRVGELTVPARIALMARVCDAVNHTHDQGIIHRDLKPSNILVDETGQPKVLDFGVARVTIADRLSGADRTRTGQLVGTLNYMSPEQLGGPAAAIDRRADVYALGVILFALLANRTPHEFESCSFAEVAHFIRDVDPPKLGSLQREFRGDVETIVAKAMEKDPVRRYQSAAELAADLRRHLGHEAIAARPPSALYQLRKFVTRNKAVVAGAAATVLALVLGLVGTLLFAIGESRQRAIAEKNAREALGAQHESEYQAYRARIAAAVGALSSHDVEEAGRQLAAAPENLRGWEWRHLSSRLEDSTSTHRLSSAIGALLIGAPDRLQYATITDVGLRLTNIDGGQGMIVPVDSAARKHVAAARTARGLRVAFWADATTIRLLDSAGQLVCQAVIPNANQPEPIVLSPDGMQFVTQCQDGEWRRLAIFDAMTGKPIAVGEGHRHGIWNISFSPNSERLATAGEDRTARIWDRLTGALLATCHGHTGKVLSAEFCSDGTRLVTASSDGTVRQWDAVSGRQVESPYDRHTGEVATATYSPDGRLVASAGTDRTVRLWLANGRQDVSVFHGHTGPVVRTAFSPDGGKLASLSLTWIFSKGEDAVRLWDVSAQSARLILRGHARSVQPVAFGPDGKHLASGSWDGTVRIWDPATGITLTTLPHPGVVADLAYGPDGKWLVTGNHGDNRLRIWDVEKARVRNEIPVPAGVFRYLSLSPDGKRVAATVHNGQKLHFQVSDVASGDPLYSAVGRALTYSPDGRWLAILEDDETTIALLDAATQKAVTRFVGHEKSVYRTVFSPDSRLLASCGEDRLVRLWTIDGGDCQVLRGHTDDVFAIAFHPDGLRLASAGRDRAVWLWDRTRGENVVRLPGHTSYIWSLAFSPDGAKLASGSGDATVRLWNTLPP